MKSKKIDNRVKVISFTGMFTALGIVMILLPMPKYAGMLTFDFADTVVLLSTLFFGPLSALSSLGIICGIQAFMLGGDGVVGFTMHFVSSGCMVIVLYYMYKMLKNHKHGLIISLIAATLIMTALMMVLNILITPGYRGIPRDVLIREWIPAILLPFNLIKGTVSGILTFILYKVLKNRPEIAGISNQD